jgi:hypothetical protein
MSVRVKLPYHLQNLAHVGSEIQVEVNDSVTPRNILDAVEEKYPMLRGTIREYETGQRRPYLRFFACQEDLSHESLDAPLPDAVAKGEEVFMIVGAIAGG